jgi:hypothetical protein
MKNFKLIALVIAIAINLSSFRLYSDDVNKETKWPIEIESEKGYVTTLYQPQLESFKENILEGRMAITIKPKDKELIFGAIWFKATMSTDLENRTVVLEKIDILKTHFPDMVDSNNIEKFSNLLTTEIESWNLEMSLDRLLASLEEVEDMNSLSDQINNNPPHIYFRTKPAVLMVIDGEPILKKDEKSGIEYVVNTPYFIVKDTPKGNYYVVGGKFWYVSEDITKGWNETLKVPSKIKKFAEKSQQDNEPDSISMAMKVAPELIVETKAAELILVEGEPDYKPIEGTTLLYVKNTESDIIMDINSQNHYVLLAGRWYYSKSLKDGDWKFTDPKKLPKEFNKIPEDSDMSSVRASIPGTTEAQTALLEQSIPQTATIDRKEAKVEVSYDGNPKFEKIEGTEVSYAVNTDKTVLLIKGSYYCVDNAVWFVSKKATGPWEVSVERPDEIDKIPPESPVYNVKYTYVYDYTPSVVYVGYLPGYTNCYVYNGVVVYGTGYYYKPWYGYYYYPRPVTWGFGVHYNPWTGWGFSFGVSYGWMSWSFHPHRGGYWGPRGYHAGYRHGYRHGYHSGYRAGYAAGNRNAHRNVYNNRSTGVRNSGNINRSNVSNNLNNRSRPSGKANNMYTDKRGNVYQRNNKGNFDNKTNRSGQQTRQKPTVSQEQRNSAQGKVQDRSRQNTTPQKQPSQATRQTNQRQQLEKSHQNRNRGTQNYNQSRQQMQRSGSRSGASSRPAGNRGGGRRR